MLPDDPRHGTYAGTVAHWFDKEALCDPCSLAERRYRKTKTMNALQGRPATHTAVGTLRRVQALHALGWSRNQIAAAANVSLHTLHSIFAHGSKRVRAATAEGVASAYDKLSMVRPEGPYAHRNRAAAQRKGWLPPLAWDDDAIDDPSSQPARVEQEPVHSSVDWAVVHRFLAGEHTLRATRAERCEIVARWTRPMVELERLGWRPERYLDRGDVA